MAREYLLNVLVSSPEKVLWEGKADSVSSENSAGAFDILSEHANFITMIEKKPIIVRDGVKEHKFESENAVLAVHKGAVTAYLDL